ncbi:MAG TPA: phosphonate C-P lyase system protein PhnG [Stellaceae bacterium]|nr:phosphonate C-P lyase system protein PhnG [Stellaceae bacterium]
MSPTAQKTQGDTAARQRWLAVLAKAPGAKLQAAWDALGDKPAYRLLRHGEIGLVMLRGRIGGTGRPFNVGEMTMTRAAVQLLDHAGAVRFTGFGHVAGRSTRHAELIALFDAMLQDPARHGAISELVIGPLAVEQQARKAEEIARVRASKVDFFTLVRGE